MNETAHRLESHVIDHCDIDVSITNDQKYRWWENKEIMLQLSESHVADHWDNVATCNIKITVTIVQLSESHVPDYFDIDVSIMKDQRHRLLVKH